MTDINQRNGTFIQVPRELYDAFYLLLKNQPTAVRVIMNFFESGAAKLDGSSETLADVEQKSLVPVFGRLREMERRLEALEKERSHQPITELRREIEDLKRSGHVRELTEIRRDIEDLKRSL